MTWFVKFETIIDVHCGFAGTTYKSTWVVSIFGGIISSGNSFQKFLLLSFCSSFVIIASVEILPLIQLLANYINEKVRTVGEI